MGAFDYVRAASAVSTGDGLDLTLDPVYEIPEGEEYPGSTIIDPDNPDKHYHILGVENDDGWYCKYSVKKGGPMCGGEFPFPDP